MGNTVIVK
ncbi:unnamed protein product, partial [Rotaria magnacalcarata]